MKKNKFAVLFRPYDELVNTLCTTCEQEILVVYNKTATFAVKLLIKNRMI